MGEDEELERIKLRKLTEMLGRGAPKDEETLLQEKKKLAFDKPVRLTDETLKEAVHENRLVVVDCWAPWCTPCYMVAPIIEELAKDYAGKILFGKLNVDKNRRTAMQYQIMGIPALLVFKNGKLVDRIVGAMPKKILEPRITRYL